MFTGKEKDRQGSTPWETRALSIIQCEACEHLKVVLQRFKSPCLHPAEVSLIIATDVSSGNQSTAWAAWNTRLFVSLSLLIFFINVIKDFWFILGYCILIKSLTVSLTVAPSLPPPFPPPSLFSISALVLFVTAYSGSLFLFLSSLCSPFLFFRLHSTSKYALLKHSNWP